MTSPPTKAAGLLLTVAGLLGLAAVVALLPILGDESFAVPEQVAAYVLAVLPVGALVYGLLILLSDLAPPRLLRLAAIAGVSGIAAAYLGGRPEGLEAGAAVLPLTLLFLADALRMTAAACLGLALAQRVTSAGVALLIAGLATAADLYSFLAGPTKTLVDGEGGSQSLFGELLGYLLLWFPTFGYPLGFALGVADFIFLSLFVAMARYLHLRPLATLLSGYAAVLLTMLVGLFLAAPLPALPFISLSFLLANAKPLLRAVLAKT